MNQGIKGQYNDTCIGIKGQYNDTCIGIKGQYNDTYLGVTISLADDNWLPPMLLLASQRLAC